jgi:phosphonate transport system ATP-binding protein
MPLLELRLANAGYNGQNVLHDVTLTLHRGERVALVGPSGAGKSTLLRLIYENLGEGAALVPQDHGLVKALSVFHNVYMGRLNAHSTWRNLRNLVRPSRDEVDAVRPVVERLGLEEELFAAVGALSGGQQQRTGVGRALYQEGGVLLGDEPVSAVDEHQSRTVLESIGEEKDTVILAMHDTQLALAYSDRILGLRKGRIVMDEPASGMSSADLAPLYKG